jgi:hypothetical protein
VIIHGPATPIITEERALRRLHESGKNQNLMLIEASRTIGVLGPCVQPSHDRQQNNVGSGNARRGDQTNSALTTAQLSFEASR